MTLCIAWQTSSYSGGTPNNDCVEVGASATSIHLRESDTPGDILAVSPAALDGLIRGVKAGEFDR